MLFFPKKEEKVSLLIDIQSSMVRGSILLQSDGEKPTIIFAEALPLPYKPHTNSSYLIKTTLKAVGDVVESAYKFINTNRSFFFGRKIETVHYILSSPWIISQAKTLTVEFDTPEKISNAYILSLIEDEREKFVPKSARQYEVMEEKIFDVRLNGYSVSDPEDKVAKRVDVSFVVSVAGKRMLELFARQCETLVKRNKVFFHSSLLLQHIGIQQVIPSVNGYMLVHVHGELTDVGIITDKTCAFFGSFPFGVRNIVRKVSLSRKVSFQSADSLLTLFTAKNLDPIHAKADYDSIINIRKGWISELMKVVDKGRSHIAIPMRIILSAWGHDEFFAECFKEAYPHSKIELLSIDDISKRVNYGEKAEHNRLVGLYVIAIHSLYVI